MTFGGLSQSIGPMGRLDLLVLFDMQGQAAVTPMETYSVELQAGDITIESDAVGLPITPTAKDRKRKRFGRRPLEYEKAWFSTHYANGLKHVRSREERPHDASARSPAGWGLLVI